MRIGATAAALQTLSFICGPASAYLIAALVVIFMGVDSRIFPFSHDAAPARRRHT